METNYVHPVYIYVRQLCRQLLTVVALRLVTARRARLDFYEINVDRQKTQLGDGSFVFRACGF